MVAEVVGTAGGRTRRVRLLEAAREELVERSGHLEVDSVARRAETSVGLIYRHYGSRAGLLGAVVGDFYRRFRIEAVHLNPAPGQGFHVRERHRTGLVVAFHYREPLAPVVLSHLHLDAEVAKVEAAHLDDVIALCARNIALEQRRGGLPADRDPGLAAAMAIGGMRHLLACALADEVDHERATEQLWLMFTGIVGVDAAG